jgi:Dockerin type I domain
MREKKEPMPIPIPIRTTRWTYSAKIALLFLACSQLAQRPAEGQAPNVSPEVSVSVNDAGEVTVFQGSPMILQGAFYLPDAASQGSTVSPLLIAAQQGSWANFVHVLVTDSAGNPQVWPTQLVVLPTGSLSLGTNDLAILAWTLPPSFTQGLAPGTYSVFVSIDTTGAQSGWVGTVKSASALVQISAPPSSVSPDQQEEQFRLLAIYDRFLGNMTQAIADLDQLLGMQLNSIGGLMTKADFLAGSGETQQALDLYNQAVDAFYVQTPNPTEPPKHLLGPQHTLMMQVLSQSGAVPAPQISAGLYDRGLQSPQVYFFDLNLKNTGVSLAQGTTIKQVTFSTISGTGQVVYDATLSPPLPFMTNTIVAGGSATVRVYADVPSSVSEFQMEVSGFALNAVGTQISFDNTVLISPHSAPTGDLNGDGLVGCDDLAVVKASFGKKVGQPGFDPRADVNGDGVVNVLDLSIVARQLPAGTTCH